MGDRPRAVSVLGLAAAFVVALSARSTRAYYEDAHVTGDEARITVDASGSARIEHTLAWQLVAGQPRIDLLGIEPIAKPDAAASLEGEDGRIFPATVSALDGRGLRVTPLEPKTLRHGHYRVRMAYTVDLNAAGELVRDGATFRLLWKGPTPRDGYDAARVTFAVPGALEEPRPLIGEGGMLDDGVTSTLKRAPDHDELTLVRPHVGKGQEVVWAVRVAARAFDAGRVAGPPPPPPLLTLEPRGHAPWVVGALLVLSLAFGALVRWTEARFDDACRRFGARARGLVPLRSWERGALSGAALFIGLSLQLADATVTGTLVIVLAMISATLRAPDSVPPARGPGEWLALRPDEAFPRRGERSWEGLAFAGAVVVLVGAGYVLRSVDSQATLLLPLDAAALLPLVLTGRRSQLPPDLLRDDAPWFRKVFTRLSKHRAVQVSPWVRIPDGASRGDELRVLAVPRAPMPGLLGIEVARSFVRTPSSFASFPEVHVRVHEGSAAASRMTGLVADVTCGPGRRPDERVYRITPPFPTRASTEILALSLCRSLTDRRVAAVAWDHEPDRRGASAMDTEPVPAVA